MTEAVELRARRREDADVLAAIHTRSRAAAMPWLAVLHDEAETRGWMRGVVLAHQQVLVAERDGRPVGFAAVEGEWLEQLYVAPESIGTGVGQALLDAVKADRPTGLSLYVFARNTRARRFYEAAGFVLVAESDGRDNEEREPDCTYRWSGISG
ncbi:GNAT family N-acetyltransferase [Blastococcus deserti]|uniref:GNAT family N-acetyltransferase n=1 Tax=Blastococcus deserti TaxID=2259033 RepID=A0ABW4X7P6_9ACTN